MASICNYYAILHALNSLEFERKNDRRSLSAHIMKIISPTLEIETEVTPELIEKVVKNLVGKNNPFAILEQTEMTYMQLLWTENGYIIEYQENSILNHYISAGYISQDDAGWILQSYSKGQPYWKNQVEFIKKDIATFSYKAGNRLGSFLGTLVRAFKGT